jgi:hypothetical protein
MDGGDGTGRSRGGGVVLDRCQADAGQEIYVVHCNVM